MQAGLARRSDGVFIATWSDETALEFPKPPADHLYFALTAQQQVAIEDSLKDPADGWYRWRIVQGEGGRWAITTNPKPPKPAPRWFVVYDPATGVVVDSARSAGDEDPQIPMDREVLEVTRERLAEINATRSHDGIGAVPAWQVKDGDLVEMPDERWALDVSGNQVILGEATFDFRAVGKSAPTDAAIAIVLIRDGAPRRVQVRLSGGRQTIKRSLPPGRYAFASGDPATYELTGVTEFEVVEEWEGSESSDDAIKRSA